MTSAQQTGCTESRDDLAVPCGASGTGRSCRFMSMPTSRRGGDVDRFIGQYEMSATGTAARCLGELQPTTSAMTIGVSLANMKGGPKNLRTVRPHSVPCMNDQLIARPLMIPFVMIVLNELGDGSSERPFTDENQPVEAGFLDCPDEPFRVRVETRGMRRQANDPNACGGECLAERDGEQRIPIVDQEALAPETAVSGIGQIATHLAHPRSRAPTPSRRSRRGASRGQ